MFVALSRFTIANDKADEVRPAFLQRPHLVDTAQGFLGMDVMSPIDNSAEIWVVTRWCDGQSYQTTWRHRSICSENSSLNGWTRWTARW
jgi:heme-degrading monooxygenase HmoA